MKLRRATLIGLVMILLATNSAIAQTWSQDGPWAGGFKKLFWDPSDTMHVVSWGWSSHDGGASWTATELPVDISEPYDYTFVFSQGEFDRMFLLAQGRLYRTIDLEDDWVDVTDTLFLGEPDLLAIASAGPDDGTLYVLAKNSFEVLIYVSTDHGSSFNLLSLFSTLAYNGMIRVNPADPNRILATSESWSAYTTDGGLNWTENYLRYGEGGGPFSSMIDVQLDPVRLDNIYVTEDLFTSAMTFQTVNGVFDETTCWAADITSLAVHPVDGSLYATFQSVSNPGGNFRSDDGGESWNQVGTFVSLPFAWEVNLPYLLSVAPHPTNSNKLLMFDRDELFQSEDRGVTGTITGRGMGYANVKDVVPDPSDPNKACLVTDLQQYWVPDEELEWTTVVNRGVRRFAPEPDPQSAFYLSGHYLYRAIGDGRELVALSDWEFNEWSICTIPGEPGSLLRWWRSTNGPLLSYSSDYGVIWEPTANQPERTYDLFPDPHVEGRVWTSGRGLMYSDNSGQNWEEGDVTYPGFEKIVPEIGTEGVYCYFHPAPTVPFLLFSDDLGQTLVQLDYPEEVTRIHDMERRPGTSRHLFISTDAGVFWTDDRGESWTLLEGPYSTPCTAIAFTPDGTGLHIGTESDGVWSGLDLFEQSGVSATLNNLPTTITLHPAWPNPFNASTRIAYDLPNAGEISVAVYNLLGRQVALLDRGLRTAGRHEVTWQADAASGTYIIRLQGEGVDQAQKVLLVK